MQRHAFISRQVAPIGRLTNLIFCSDGTVEIVCVGEASRFLAKDTGVIPGDAADEAVADVDDGGKVGVDVLGCCVVVSS